jgi:hypothetical protein
MAHQQKMQAILIQRDRVRRMKDILLLYGIQCRYMIMLQQLIKRLEKAARVTAWPDNQRRSNEFFMCLREDTLLLYNT